MFRILIWGLGRNYDYYIKAIKYHELIGELEVIGVTDEKFLYTCLDGYRFIPKSQISSYDIDYIVVTSEQYFSEIIAEAMELGFSEQKLILAKIFCMPEFDFGKYHKLLESRVSIIANNCWGGFMYHALGMKYYSPFINMFEGDESYIKLLNNLQYYLRLELKFTKYGYNPLLKREYPICRLEDVELHFNHAVSMSEIETKWYERVERINWDNLFIMMMMRTENDKLLEQFEQLEYKKKLCFTSFESTKQSVFSLCELYKKVYGQGTQFWELINGIPQGIYHVYNLIDLLLTGEVNHGRYWVK